MYNLMGGKKMQTKCPHCSNIGSAPDGDLGKKITCSSCHRTFVVAKYELQVTPTSKSPDDSVSQAPYRPQSIILLGFIGIIGLLGSFYTQSLTDFLLGFILIGIACIVKHLYFIDFNQHERFIYSQKQQLPIEDR